MLRPPSAHLRCLTLHQIFECWLNKWWLRWSVLDLVWHGSLLLYHCCLIVGAGIHVSFDMASSILASPSTPEKGHRRGHAASRLGVEWC
jgi:hypothetical protein